MPPPASRGFAPIFRALLRLVAAALAVAVVLGLFGSVLPVFDSIGQFRAHAAVALAVAGVVLLVARQGTAGLGALAVAAVGLYSVAPFVLAARPGAAAAAPGAPRYTLLQMNLRFDAPDRSRALSLIARLRPDVVTAQELTPEWKEDLEKLRGAFPFRFYCREPFRHGSDTAILSRRPFAETDVSRRPAGEACNEEGAFAAKTIDFNGLPVTIASQHLRWPWPGRQWRMLGVLQPVLATLRDPLIIAGDFNAAPWSASVARYAAASRTRILAGIGPSWIADFLPPALARHIGLPLDNVLVSEGIEVLGVKTLEPTASDHLPVLVTFTMRFALPEEPDVRSAGR